MNTRKKKRGRGATVHWQSRRMQMTGCALGRLTKKKEKKRNQSCWFPSSSCRLEKKKKSHFHLPTSAADRLFISRLRSERHDPADKFQSSSFAYSSASSLFFYYFIVLFVVCVRSAPLPTAAACRPPITGRILLAAKRRRYHSIGPAKSSVKRRLIWILQLPLCSRLTHFMILLKAKNLM